MSLRLRKSKNAGAWISNKSAERVGRPSALNAAGSSHLAVLAMPDLPPISVIYFVYSDLFLTLKTYKSVPLELTRSTDCTTYNASLQNWGGIIPPFYLFLFFF